MKIIHSLFLLFLSYSMSLFTYDNQKNNNCFTMVSPFSNIDYDQSKSANQSNFCSGFYNNLSIQPSRAQSSLFNMSDQEYAAWLVQAVVNEIMCRKVFHMTFANKEKMKKLSYDNFVSTLLQRDDLCDQAVMALWDEYKNKRVWNWNNEKEENEIKIKKALQNRRKEKEQQKIQWQQQEREKQAELSKQYEIQEQKKLQDQYLKDLQKQEHEYLTQIYDVSIQNMGQHCSANDRFVSRKQALEQTKLQSFDQYEQQYYLPVQTEAYLRLYNIDLMNVNYFYGTAFQQQLHCEVCEIFNSAANLQQNFIYQSSVLGSSILCADAAREMNDYENIVMATSLTDLGFAVLDVVHEYRKAVCNGVISSVQGFMHILAHPIETIESVGNALSFVLETAALNYYDEEYGFEDLYIPLRDQRNAEIMQGLKNLGDVFVNSTGPQKLEALTRFGADFFVPGKIMQAIGGVMGAVKSEIKFVQAYESFAVAAVGDQTAFSEISYEVAQMMQKSESLAQETIAQQTVGKLMECEKQIEKTAKLSASQKIKRIGDSRPKEIDIRSLLDKNLEILEEVSQEAARIEHLSDGRIRYYKSETAASTPGPTRGFAYVLEYDPSRGMIRGWYEGYTHAGKVNRVHPKMINGKDIVSLHYPHTKKELELIAQKVKVKK